MHKFYTLSSSAIDAMRDAVRAATTSVYWESYIFQNDIIPTHNFIDLFRQKAEEGVRVVIILDGFGSYSVRTDEIDTLKAAGAEVLFFTHWFRRIHRKILVVDEQIGFFGGVNVGSQYVQWLDLHLRVTGKLVRSLVRTFAHSYAVCGGTDPMLLAKQKLAAPVARTKIWLLEHWPVLGKRKLRKHYEERIRDAHEHITIVTPYFLPHSWLVRALKEAQKRGVAVDVLLPQYTSPKGAGIANYLNARRLTSDLMHFYFTPEMIHAKALLIDNTEGMVGSQNIDALSFDHNTEMSAVFKQKSMIRDLTRIISGWKAQAIPFDRLPWKQRWYHRPLVTLLDFLQPIL